MASPPNDAVYIDKPWLLMRWDGEHACLFAEWKGFATSAEFQGALLKAVDVIREKKAAAFVTDTRKLELVSDDDQRWLVTTWPILALEAGLKRLAIVMAKSGLSKMAILDMFRSGPNTVSSGEAAGEGTFQSRTFESVDDALRWVSAR